jgi:hypothetical protein
MIAIVSSLFLLDLVHYQLGIPSISYSQVQQNESSVAGFCFRHGDFNTFSKQEEEGVTLPPHASLSRLKMWFR